jgi:Phage Mu protein F like protein
MSLHDIADAANGLADLLEATAPKGLKHPKHAKHVNAARASIKAVMRKYFERQRKAVLATVDPRIKRALIIHPVKESAAGKTFARDLVPTSLHPLTFAATASETSEYDGAITDLIAAAAKSLDMENSEDIASKYLRENSLSKLTGELNSTSVERLQNAIADAWDAGGSYTDIVGAIKDTFEDFSDQRADLIAQTEAADAYNAGRRETALALDFDEHSWETESGDPCPVCEENESQGWIDIDEDFSSGDDAPTAHPNCLCVANFRKSSGDDEDEG